VSRKLFQRDRRPQQRRSIQQRRVEIRSTGGARMTASSKAAGSMVDRYLDLPYHVTLVRDPDGNGSGWTAGVEELPGCSSRGGTPDEAVKGVRQAMAAWIAGALEEGRDVPEPKTADDHSGRLLLRMPKTLHADLTRLAEREGVSLNQLITDALASVVGWRSPDRRAAGDKANASITQVPGAEALTPEQEAGPESPEVRSRRFLTVILTANFVVLAIAALVAALVLIAAWL
jgi:antitoxin HicB